MVLILAETLVLEAGWVNLAIMAFALLVSAVLLSMQEEDQISDDDFPKQYSSRGSYIPLIIGRRRVGGVVCWIQPEASGQLQLGSGGEATGKGLGGSPRSPNYSESGVHLVCIGPAAALHGIYQNGKSIFSGTITPESTPSGSLVNTNGEGDFRVYWGFPDDPVSNMMAAASNHGSIPGRASFATRYPNVMRIEWDKKLLGSTPLWPRLEYEVEVHPHLSAISKSRKLLVGNATFNEPLYNNGPGLVRQRVWSVTDNSQPKWNENEECEIVLTSAIPFWGAAPAIADRSNDVSSYFKGGDIIYLYGERPMLSADLPNPMTIGTATSQTIDNVTLNPVPRSLGINYMGGAYSAGPPEIEQGVAYWVVRSEYNSSTVSFPAEGFIAGQLNNGRVYLKGFTRIYAKRIVTGVEYEGTAPWSSNRFAAQAVKVLGNDGVNPAYAIDQLMFAPYPWGAGLAREFFDMNSLEDVGARLGLEGPEEERVAVNLAITNGQEADSVIGEVLQDLGCLLSWSAETGKYRFELVRETADQVTVPDEAILDPLPEIEVLHGFLPSERIAFTYKSRLNNYRDLSIQVGDEGQANLIDQANTKKVPIKVSTDFASARNVALRRQQEVTNNAASIKLRLSRNATLLHPGMLINVPKLGLDTPLRVMTVKRDTLSSEVEVGCLLDHYGVPAIGASVTLGEDEIPPRLEVEGLEGDWFAIGSGTVIPQEVVIPQETLFTAFELPRAFTDGKQPVLAIAHAKTFPAMVGAEIWASRDEALYRQLGTSADFWTAIALEQAIDDSWEIAEGPEAKILSLDGLAIENLSDPTLEESWRAGRQLLVLTDGTDFELCYLRSALLLADNRLQLQGVIRARAGTPKIAWGPNTLGWIATSHVIFRLIDPLLQPGKNVFVRAQPFTTSKSLALDLVDAVEVPVTGKSMRPSKPGALRTANHRNGWRTDEDLVLRWEYATPDKPLTGAGNQDFGTPFVTIPADGKFRVTLTGATTTVVLETSLPELTYTYANIQDKFPGEETIDIAVEHVDGVLASEPAELTVTFLS